MAVPTIGDKIYIIIRDTEVVFFKLGELAQLCYDSFNHTAKKVNAATEETITIRAPIGRNPDGTTMVGESSYSKKDLIQHGVTPIS